MTEFPRGAAIVIADLHLHLYKGESTDRGMDRLQDGLQVLRQSLDAARAHQCPWLNLGDNKMPRAFWPLEVLNGMLSTLREYPDVDKLIVLGNHDGDTTHGSGLLALSEHATIVDKPLIVGGFGHAMALPPLAVWPAGANWTDYPEFLRAAKDRKVRLLLSHIFALGAVLGVDEVRLPGVGAPLEKLGLTPSGPFVLALLGDVHKMQYWRRYPARPPFWAPGLPPAPVTKWDGMAIYPGSPYMQSWGERIDRTKGFLHVDFAAGTVTQIPSAAPEFMLLDFTAAPNPAILLEQVRGAPLVHGHFVRLRLPEFMSPGVQARVMGALAERGTPRTLWVEVVTSPQVSARVDDLHAGLPQGELLAQYVKARPLEGVPPAQVLTALKRLMDDDT